MLDSGTGYRADHKVLGVQLAGDFVTNPAVIYRYFFWVHSYLSAVDHYRCMTITSLYCMVTEVHRVSEKPDPLLFHDIFALTAMNLMKFSRST